MHVPGNYWPISLISVVIQAFDCIIHPYLVSALGSHYVLSPSQPGFGTKRYTVHVTLLTETVSDWSLFLGPCSTVHCLLLDFAKAFGSVPHEHLLSSLKIHGDQMYSNC